MLFLSTLIALVLCSSVTTIQAMLSEHPISALNSSARVHVEYKNEARHDKKLLEKRARVFWEHDEERAWVHAGRSSAQNVCTRL